jgi:hypothetical protein
MSLPPPTVPGRFALHPHPATPVRSTWSVEVSTHWSPLGLVIEYAIAVPAGRIVLPRRSESPAARDFLWKRTCGELFVGVRGEPSYIEFNLSPSGDWASYEFDGYRENSRPRPWQGPSPVVRVMQGEGATRLLATVPHAAFHVLRREDPAAALQAGFTLVLETTPGDISFWALKHPRAQPEFHDRDGFIADFTVSE